MTPPVSQWAAGSSSLSRQSEVFWRSGASGTDGGEQRGFGISYENHGFYLKLCGIMEPRRVNLLLFLFTNHVFISLQSKERKCFTCCVKINNCSRALPDIVSQETGIFKACFTLTYLLLF